MHSVFIEPVYLGDVVHRFGHCARHADLAARAAALNEPACAVSSVADAEQGITCPTLFLWLPQVPSAWLRELAETNFTVYNWTTANLEHNVMYVSLETPQLEVRWKAWEVDFPSRNCDGQFRLVLVSGRHAAIALHRVTGDDWEILEGGMQGCGISSGPNYSAHRIWSDAELEEARGAQDQQAPGQMTARRIALRGA